MSDETNYQKVIRIAAEFGADSISRYCKTGKWTLWFDDDSKPSRRATSAESKKLNAALDGADGAGFGSAYTPKSKFYKAQ